MNSLVPRRYREVSLATVDVDLTVEGLRGHFLGREAYRRTRYVIAQRGDETALVEVETESRVPLFSPIAEVSVLALPHECAVVHAPEVDTGVANQLLRTAEERASGARCVVVHGLYEHVSFILDPQPLEIHVVEVAPPLPAKLVDQAQRVLETSSQLPPIRLVPVVIDLRRLAEQGPATSQYLLPCRGSGVTVGDAEVSYLDERPAHRDWVLVGCARSREIHRWFYGGDAPNVEMCPRILATANGTPPMLTKCCLLEDRVETDGLTVTVPWGSSLEEVETGLAALVRAVEPSWAAG